MIINNLCKILFLFVFSICCFTAKAQNYTLSGKVINEKTNQPISDAFVQLKGDNQNTTTDEKGFYSFKVTKGDYTLSIDHANYEFEEISLTVLDKNVSKDVHLFPLPMVSLEEVVLTNNTQAIENVAAVQTGVEKISIEEINKLPVLLGERDIIKSIQLTPGIKSAGEGNGGFFVRGGTADQNSILLDKAPLYNASHLFGFFSTFNSDAIKGATIYKGAMPAQYGERLASVLDIEMKDGDDQKYHYNGGIGLISSRISAEGPIIKDKASFLISARRTYADAVAKAVGVKEAKDASLYFYDLNLKINYQLSEKDKLSFSAYNGRDKLGIRKVVDTEWGNTFAALNWRRKLNANTWSMNTYLIYSRYDYKVDLDLGQSLYLSSNINDFILKQEFEYFINPKNNLKFGYSSTHHSISPGKFKFDESSGNNKTLKDRNSLENGLFITHTAEITDKLNAIYGLRLNTFSLLGGKYYELDANKKVMDTINSNKTYINLEPRISMAYRLNDESSIKMAYGRSSQNMHMLSNSAQTNPTDRWASSTNIIKPQIADQLTLGYFRNFARNTYEFSVETYYKKMQNQIDFKDHANFFQKDVIESELLFGKGRAYGVELLFRKRAGRLTGWIGYTLSKSEKQINGINSDKWYDATQDRTHDISLVGIYELNKKWTLSAAWVYNTGNAVTYPSGKYEINGELVPYYTERNGYRAPAYHRLDLGATYILKDTEKFYSELAFSLYNAYGRENAYMIEFRSNDDDPNKATAYQYSLFKYVPSVSWNFRF